MTPAELRAAMTALPEPITNERPPHWSYWRLALWQHVVHGDNPARFWEWPVIYHTMLQAHWINLVEKEYYQMFPYFEETPYLYPPKNGVFDYLKLGSHLSANLIKQLYHVHQWEKVTGKKIADLSTIVEFGAGYGALAMLVHRLGFKGTYYILDLPEFQKLQEYYLSNTGETTNVEWIERDNKKLKRLKPDLLIALYSLSEVPYSLRDEILDTLKAKSHLFLYSNRFADYDNVAYFDGYTRRAGGNWRTWVIEHMPPQSLYSIGWTE